MPLRVSPGDVLRHRRLATVIPGGHALPDDTPDIERSILSLAGKIGAHRSWARTVDRTARTAKARAAGPNGLEWHAKKLDPEGKLDEHTRMRLAESARAEYFARLTRASLEARAKRRAS